MKKSFEKIIGNIYRLKVPFENLYTSVFLIRTERGNAIVDCATYDSDVDDFILPALSDLGLSLDDITCLVLSHRHKDHAGGMKKLLYYNPYIEIIQSGCSISLPDVTVYELKGHTSDCIGVFEGQSATLISADGLQGQGVGKYRCHVESEEWYLETIDRIQRDVRIENILFSHAYEPWNKDGVFGRENVEKCLRDCIESVKAKK